MADTRSNNVGAFVDTTSVWDPSQILSVDVQSEEFKQLLVRLYQNLNVMAQVLNIKESGFYSTDEFVTGQQFFPDPSLSSSSQLNPSQRSVFRKVINIGALAGSATTTAYPHGITVTSAVTFTRIYGVASDPSTTFIPLPYPSATAADVIEVFVDATNVRIVTGKDQSAFTTAYIVVEYLKS